MTDLINVEIFASVSGMSLVNKSAAVKMYGLSEKKSYSDWYDLLNKDFNVPNDMRKEYGKDEEKASYKKTKSKEILEKISKEKEQ